MGCSLVAYRKMNNIRGWKVKQMEAFLWVIPLSWYVAVFWDFLLRSTRRKKEPSFFTCNRCSTRSHSQVNLFPHFHEISHENLRNYIVKTFIFFHSQIGERRWDANGEQHSTNLCFIHKIHNEFCWKRTQERRKLFACLEAWENCYMRGESLVTMSISNYLFTYEPLNHSHNILQKPFLSTVCLCTLLLHNHTSMLPPPLPFLLWCMFIWAQHAI